MAFQEVALPLSFVRLNGQVEKASPESFIYTLVEVSMFGMRSGLGRGVLLCLVLRMIFGSCVLLACISLQQELWLPLLIHLILWSLFCRRILSIN